MPEDRRSYDVVVIGAGPAGENVAGRCADGGLSVAIVERELVGGECSYWACIPSKALLRPGDVLAQARRVPGAAAAAAGRIDVDRALAWRDALTAGWDDTGALGWLEEKRIALHRGVGRLDGARTVVVEQPDGGTLRLGATRAVVLATGTRAALPPIEGLAEAQAWDNRDAAQATSIPDRLIVLGGGPVGVELAQAFARLGSSVTLLESSTRVLAREEPFASREVLDALTEDGVDIRLEVAARAVRRAGDGTLVVHVGQDELRAEALLVAAGRTPATAQLGLETVGLEPGRPVEVGDDLRAVGVEDGWLYAVGDCNGRALLTHMGKYQARIAADVILGRPATAIADHGIVPRVTFTDPQVCAVGLTEGQARDAGLPVRTVRHATGGVAGATVHAESFVGSSQLVIDEARRIVVGATFVGPGVQELLHSATVAVAGEVPLERLWHAVPAFPTVSEVWLRLLEAYGL